MATYNVNTSGFTPAQLTAFQNASKLAAPGNTVNATAGAANVKNPNAPTPTVQNANFASQTPRIMGNTSSQSSYIQSQASQPNLVNQLYSGQTPTYSGVMGAGTGSIIPNSTIPNSTVPAQTGAVAGSGGQPVGNGQTTVGSNVSQPMTTMYDSTGKQVSVPTANVSMNTYNETSNPNGYYATNPTSGPTVPSTTGSASQTSSGNASTAGLLGSMSPAQSQAYQKAQDINQQLEQSRQNEANTIAGITTQPIPLEFQQGQSQVVQGQYTQQQAALGSQLQAQAGLVGALSPSNTTQQVGQGTTVLGGNGQPIATTPVIGPVGSQTQYQVPPTTYNAKGEPVQSSTPTPPPPTYTVQSGDTLSAIAARNNLSTAQLEQLNPQFTDPNKIEIGDKVFLPSSGTTSNTPYTAGVVAGQAAAGASVVQMKTAYTASQAIGSRVINDIQSNSGLNSSPVGLVNALNQWVNSTAIPSGPYVNFLNDLQEYANTLAPVLGVGGNTTDLKTTIAQNMVPVLASGGTITQALQHLDQLAADKINGAITGAQSGGGAAVPSTQLNAGGMSQSTPSSVSAGGYSYQLVNGKWVVSQGGQSGSGGVGSSLPGGVSQ